MDTGIYQASQALYGLEKLLDAAGLNISNSQKTGHKEVIFATQGSKGVYTQYSSNGQKIDTQGVIPEAVPTINFSQGPIIASHLPTDLAIQGDYFFELIDSSGEKIYTKNGEFHFNKDNELVSSDGKKVSNVSSSPINQINNGESIIVSREGKISQGAQEIGKIGVFKVDTASLIECESGFKLPPNKKAQVAEKFEVKQYALEGSNTTVSKQMTYLMKAQHLYQANSEMVKGFDQASSKLLQNINSI